MQRIKAVTILLLLAILAFGSACTTTWSQNRKQRKAVETIKTEFPIGISLEETLKKLEELEIIYTYAKPEMVKHAGTPTEGIDEGGPLIWTRFNLGTTWWGFGSQFQYLLFFDEADILKTIKPHATNTFL